MDEEKLKMDLGDRLKKLRDNHKFSTRQLGERLNISHSHIAQMEKGQRTPSIEMLNKYADFFDVHVSQFFGERQEVPQDLSDKGVKWMAFGDKMEKRGLTIEELERIADFIDTLPPRQGED